MSPRTPNKMSDIAMSMTSFFVVVTVLAVGFWQMLEHQV